MITAEQANRETEDAIEALRSAKTAECRLALEDEIEKAINRGCYNINFRPASRIIDDVIIDVLADFAALGYKVTYQNDLVEVDWS